MLEQYLMPVLMSYIEKYVKNISLDKVSLWGGDIVLRNLELRLDVLEDEVSFTNVEPLRIVMICLLLRFPFQSKF